MMGNTRKSKARKASKRTKELIGREVWFRGRVWRVVSSRDGSQGSPWLTLMRGFGIKAQAKVYEVSEAYN